MTARHKNRKNVKPWTTFLSIIRNVCTLKAFSIELSKIPYHSRSMSFQKGALISKIQFELKINLTKEYRMICIVLFFQRHGFSFCSKLHAAENSATWP